MLHHSDVVTVGEVVGNLAVPHSVHMDVLYLEVPTGRLYAHKHPPVDGSPTYATMHACERAANDNPLGFNDGIQNGQLNIRKGALDILEDGSHTRASNLPTVVSGIFGKKLRSAFHVAAIERFVLLLHQIQVDVGSGYILTFLNIQLANLAIANCGRKQRPREHVDSCSFITSLSDALTPVAAVVDLESSLAFEGNNGIKPGNRTPRSDELDDPPRRSSEELYLGVDPATASKRFGRFQD